jgi:predicted nucleotidyltransferase
MMSRFGLKPPDLDQIRGVFSRYPQVKKVILYGSRAMGTHKTVSDIDLTLCGKEDLTLDILYRIMEDLDNLLLPYTFDLSIFRHIKDEDVIAHINRVGCTFYTRKNNRSFQSD